MDKNRKIDIMAIMNFTDNSYFAESRMLGKDVDEILVKIDSMVKDGATILDLGACSTRPGSDPVGAEEEWKRFKAVLPEIRQAFPKLPISIDTWWADVISRIYDLIGEVIVNDISAGEDDPKMLSLVGNLGLTYIAMNKRGNQTNMQSLCEYEDVAKDVLTYFKEFAEKADKHGIKDWIVDPGFGFAKSVQQNYDLLSELSSFHIFDKPILVGVSRKSMIYRLFDITPEEALAQTQILHYVARQQGASILRVHDVAETARTITTYRKLK